MYSRTTVVLTPPSMANIKIAFGRGCCTSLCHEKDVQKYASQKDRESVFLLPLYKISCISVQLFEHLKRCRSAMKRRTEDAALHRGSYRLWESASFQTRGSIHLDRLIFVHQLAESNQQVINKIAVRCIYARNFQGVFRGSGIARCDVRQITLQRSLFA